MHLLLLLQLHYISPNIGTTGTSSAQSATSVFAYIGTPPQMRCTAPLTWKQGPCMLIEEALTEVPIARVYNLGPNYVGCLQAVPQGKTLVIFT